jgi:hypothetical protein
MTYHGGGALGSQDALALCCGTDWWIRRRLFNNICVYTYSVDRKGHIFVTVFRINVSHSFVQM